MIDWDGGGRDGLAMLDLLHLYVSSIRERTALPFGVAVAKHLLAVERPTDIGLVQAYCKRLGLRVSERRFRALTFAYWFFTLGRELRHPDGSEKADQRWDEENILPGGDGAKQRPWTAVWPCGCHPYRGPMTVGTRPQLWSGRRRSSQERLASSAATSSSALVEQAQAFARSFATTHGTTTAGSRRSIRRLLDRVEVFRGDLANPEAVAGARSSGCEVVFHLGA